jgi:hypothetical protein
MSKGAHTRVIKFGKFGLAEDPIGQHVLMPDGSIREVYGTYRREFPSVVMLKVRSFNREIVDEIAAGSAKILDRSWEESK